LLMVEEAGGAVSELFGDNWNISSPNILVSNGLIHEQMTKIFKNAVKK